MKKLIIILSVLFISCSSESIEEEIQLDCDCDRYAQINTFNIANSPNPIILVIYTTINDCTEVQREGSFSVLSNNDVPQVGDCK